MPLQCTSCTWPRDSWTCPTVCKCALHWTEVNSYRNSQNTLLWKAQRRWSPGFDLPRSCSCSTLNRIHCTNHGTCGYPMHKQKIKKTLQSVCDCGSSRTKAVQLISTPCPGPHVRWRHHRVDTLPRCSWSDLCLALTTWMRNCRRLLCVYISSRTEEEVVQLPRIFRSQYVRLCFQVACCVPHDVWQFFSGSCGVGGASSGTLIIPKQRAALNY